MYLSTTCSVIMNSQLSMAFVGVAASTSESLDHLEGLLVTSSKDLIMLSNRSINI